MNNKLKEENENLKIKMKDLQENIKSYENIETMSKKNKEQYINEVKDYINHISILKSKILSLESEIEKAQNFESNFTVF